LSADPNTTFPLRRILLFALLTFLAGFAAVIAVHLLLVGLSLMGVEAVSRMRTVDAVCLLESAWCASAAAFAFWGSRDRVQTPAQQRRGLERWGVLLSVVLACLALTTAGIFIERQIGSSVRAP